MFCCRCIFCDTEQKALGCLYRTGSVTVLLDPFQFSAFTLASFPGFSPAQAIESLRWGRPGNVQIFDQILKQWYSTRVRQKRAPAIHCPGYTIYLRLVAKTRLHLPYLLSSTNDILAWFTEMYHIVLHLPILLWVDNECACAKIPTFASVVANFVLHLF